MSPQASSHSAATRRRHAPVFAALGHETRLQLVSRLAAGDACSITQLCERTRLSRQAVTKHLLVLEHAGLVRGERRGRENRYSYQPAGVAELGAYLESISRQWDEALGRLKAFVEENP
ncbi:MAG: helix-turn-helix transcriptional regulator [bacterium]|nr:helix-turn-helix transcriptional regulator [bacterium]